MKPQETREHLRELGRTVIGGAGPVLLDGDVAYVVAAYKTSVSAVDVANPARPRTLWTLPFKGQLFGQARFGKDLWVTESLRALDAVDVSDPARPRYHDCLVLLRHRLNDVRAVGDRLLVGCGAGGLQLVDPSGRRPQVVARLTFDDGVQGFAVDGDRVFVALGSGGLAVARRAGDQLAEIARPLPQGPFYVKSVRLAGDAVYCSGKARKGADDLVVLDRTEPSRELFRGESPASGAADLLQLGGRTVCLRGHHCLVLEAPGRARPVFDMFRARDDQRYLEVPEGERVAVPSQCMDDVGGIALRDGVLFAAQGPSFTAYQVQPGSAFAVA